MYVTSILGPTSDISNSLLHKSLYTFHLMASVVNDRNVN